MIRPPPQSLLARAPLFYRRWFPKEPIDTAFITQLIETVTGTSPLRRSTRDGARASKRTGKSPA